MRARATWETGREGKGFTSRSEPRSSISSCQPGKVARRMKQTKAKIIATMLGSLLVQYFLFQVEGPYIKYGKMMLSLKVLATHIRFNGS